MFRPQTGSQEEPVGLETIPEDDGEAPPADVSEPQPEAEAEAGDAAAEQPAVEAAAEEPAAEEPAAEEPAAEPPAAVESGDYKVGPGGSKLYTFETWRARGGHFGQLALNRFCPWTIAKRDALLLHGKPRFGVIEFEGQLYSFNSEAAVKEALMGMEGLMEKMKVLVRRSPELINLLQLEQVFPSASVAALVEGAFGGSDSKTRSIDSDCQTDTHFNDGHIDPSYEWNEWALRRRGVQLANLRNKRTHSTQTGLSHFRADTETQTWLPKDKEQNTLQDAKTQAPKLVSYMRGLRGRPSKQFSVVNMTLE